VSHLQGGNFRSTLEQKSNFNLTMGECKRIDWQAGATSVRDRMDHLYNNPDMSDLHITAVDEQWSWGQTVKDFIGHKLVLCTASPVFHQLFFPKENGPDIPKCLLLTKMPNSAMSKLEIEGVPPIAVENLLEYCYKDRFDKADFENGYSRNLLWRLWQIAKVLHMNHLFELCSEALDTTMCEETVFWDLNYSLEYQEIGTDHIKQKVAQLTKSLDNHLYTHPNFVFLDHISIREMLSKRLPGSSEPLIVFNNVLRWAIFQLDRTLLEEVDDIKGSDIPVTERSKLINKIRQEKIKEYTFSDISKYLDMVLDLVPWAEFSQFDFLEFVASADVLPKEMLLSASLSVMTEVVKNPERLAKSTYLLVNDPNVVKSELNKAMDSFRTKTIQSSEQKAEQANNKSSPREKADIKAKLEEARQRRLLMENNRLSKNVDQESVLQQSNLLLVE